MWKWVASYLRKKLDNNARRTAREVLTGHPPEDFDSHWYLNAYPDVAASGIDPWLHYQRHGRSEGRLPRRNRAIAWDHALWRGADSVMLARLFRLVESAEASLEEQQYARWALARWWAWQNNWAVLPDWLSPLLMDWPTLSGNTSTGPALLAVEACARLALETDENASNEALHRRVLEQALMALQQHAGEHADTFLAQSNMALAQGNNEQERLAPLNAMWSAQGLATVRKASANLSLTLDNLAPEYTAAESSEHEQPPRISVVIPLYNAAGSIATAVRSLFAQRFLGSPVPFEIIVVDDASVDASVAAVEALRADCPSHVELRILHHRENKGAYAARNTGVAASRGELITTHDSDDWSHPDKLRLQVEALSQVSSVEASISWWVRATPGLLFHRWRLEGEGWVYPNLSSLMVRREALDQLGFWDDVKVNADSEFRERLEAVFGEKAVCEVLPGVPLSFGRADASSLSQHTHTHLATQFLGVRHDYMASARRWHQSAKPAGLFLSQHPARRPFAAPAAICRQSSTPTQQAAYQHPLDTLQAAQYEATPWFDAGWYLRTYIDLQQSLIDPLSHYWREGESQGRDPSPHFSVSGYRYLYAEEMRVDKKEPLSPLLHFLQTGRSASYSPRPVIQGFCTLAADQPTVLVCGHAAGETLYGAERSLLDVVRGLRGLGMNVVVALPSAANQPYIKALREASLAVAILPYGWWQQGKQLEHATCDYFRQLMQQFDIAALHANTAILDEPLHAARALGIPTIMHVRELPEHDSALRATLNASAVEIMERVRELADIPVANSQCVATAIACERTLIVPNTIDMLPLLDLPVREANASVRIGMLSSNLAKKGLSDVTALVNALAHQTACSVEVWLFGPPTSDLACLLRHHDEASTGIRIIDGGYVESPAHALAELDVVMNLSHFQESFGRTVLEAMAAARPVVCYAWGALAELVIPDKTGYLVPFGDINAMARQLTMLADAPELRHTLGHAGREHAIAHFSPKVLQKALAEVYDLALHGDSRKQHLI
ncbi:MAG: glycosyltransferase [Pseudomonadota bacterium]